MASLHNSIAVDESIEDIINSHGINNLIEDCRNTDKYWAFNTLWNSGLNHSTVIELPSDKFMPLRDYAILSKSLIFYEEDGVHYVTFIVSDGDNMQWLLGSNFTMKNWFGSRYRGNFNLGWSISPSIYNLAPTVFEKYYNSAHSSKYKDYFLVPPSGNGYMYPSKYPYEKLSDYTKKLNDYMAEVDQKYVLILDDEAFYKKDLWDKYTCNSNIDALLYLNYDKNNAYDGKII